MKRTQPETYQEQLGRVRAMIAGTAEYDSLPDHDRAAIRTVFRERVAFLDVCSNGSMTTKLDWLQSHLNDLQRTGEPDRSEDPEAYWECVRALQALHDGLKALCDRADGSSDGALLNAAPALLAACKGVAPGVVCVVEQIRGKACGKTHCPACSLHAAIAQAEAGEKGGQP